MVEPFTDVPASPSVLALETSVLLVDRKLATRRTGLREKGDEAHIVLAGMGIRTVGELIRHYPRRYIDRSAVERIGELRIGQQATVIARVHKTTKRLTRRRQSMVTVTITDGTGYLDLTFFNQPWAAGIYKEGLEVALVLDERFLAPAFDAEERRLENKRRTRPAGIQVGAYGFVEHVKPREAASASQGYVLAPSLTHATTAAILRSGWAAFGGDGQRGALAVDLTTLMDAANRSARTGRTVQFGKPGG